MQKKSRIAELKEWYNVVQPSKKLFMISMLTACFTSVSYVFEPIAAANAVTEITNQNYKWAIIWIVLGFMALTLRNIFWHINYWNYERLLGYSYKKISSKIYKKIIGASDKNFKETSKEKILNIISSDIYTVSNFADIICTKTSYLFRVVVTIIVVFTSSPIAGAIIIAISVLNYFLLTYAGKKIGHYGKKVSESKDSVLEKVIDISDARAMIRDNNLEDDIEEKYIDLTEPYIKSRYKRTLWNSFVDNWVYVIWQAIICATTVYLIYLVSGNNLTLTSYLVIVGYLSPTIEKVNSFILIFKEQSVADVSVNRIKTIMDFSPKELIEFGSRKVNKIEGTLDFVNVSVDSESLYHTEYVNSLNDFNMSVSKGSLVLICGQKNCGKRSIFHILRRAIKPDSGKVLLGGIDLYDYDPSVHHKNIAYTTHKPFFFKGTILDNLMMFNKNRKQILKACQEIGVLEAINALPNKFNTQIDDLKMMNEKEVFLLGFCRALLSTAEIIVIYEFPTQLSARDRADLAQLFRKLTKDRTIIVFSHHDEMSLLCDKVVYISRGKIEKIVENTNN